MTSIADAFTTPSVKPVSVVIDVRAEVSLPPTTLVPAVTVNVTALEPVVVREI